MLIRLKIPKTLHWVINLFFIFLAIFTLFRFATYFAFKPADLHFADLLPSFLLGIRFDLRWIAVILLPVIVISMIPRFSPFYSERNKKWWTWYMVVLTFIIILFFAVDFGNFSYNKTRLNASALNFVEDPSTSIAMIWQTYPVISLLFMLGVAVLILRWVFRKLHVSVIIKTDGRGIPYRRKWFFVSLLLLVFFVYGSMTWPPLSWKKAFELKDNFKSYLALNPLQNFFTTLKFRKPQFNENRAREYFPVMADLLQLKNKDEFSFRREIIPGSIALESNPNIVLVMCESFSMYKSSMSGNPLNTTPYFQQLCKQGIFFERCFTPHFSTARGLFAIITGIPDVQLSKFSTRNPLAIKQHTIINNFEGYDKFYFLGGNPEFNNFGGFLKNIDGLQMIAEGKLHSPKMNVWGISDKNLFLEANSTFKQQTKPFFAIIQTADNHRPFMIPEEDKDFTKEIVSKDSLQKFGFESLEEFNSFRYSDYCFKKFIEAAKKESYFHNTIFVFVGDHGVSGNADAVYPSAWTTQGLTNEHVPLLFYAPFLLEPQNRKETASQIDVLPTIAGMLDQSYVNTTLGRDLLYPAKQNDFAFVIHHDEGEIGIVTDSYYFTRNINFTDERLYPVNGNTLSYSKWQQDSIKSKMSRITTSFYETAKWMLMNNKR
jgi:phosphoglycerol transferase MdoB-like AlkP superfamily enzyme